MKGAEFEKHEEFEFLKLSHGDTPLQNLKKIREQAGGCCVVLKYIEVG